MKSLPHWTFCNQYCTLSYCIQSHLPFERAMTINSTSEWQPCYDICSHYDPCHLTAFIGQHVGNTLCSQKLTGICEHAQKISNLQHAELHSGVLSELEKVFLQITSKSATGGSRKFSLEGLRGADAYFGGTYVIPRQKVGKNIRGAEGELGSLLDGA